MVVGSALALLVVACIIAVAFLDGDDVSDGPMRGFPSPNSTPFPHSQRVSLSEAEGAAGFEVYRPTHGMASDESLTDVWVASMEGSDVQVALWYQSGLEVHLTPVASGDRDPLSGDFPPDIEVTFETIAGTEMRVIRPGVQDPGQPGSVAMVRADVVITLYGWMDRFDVEQLKEIAATVS